MRAAKSRLNVVVTIPPLHSLATSVLDGVAEPQLLIKGARSPHDYKMRPAEIKMLREADLIIRIDETFETGLSRAISRLRDNQTVLSMMRMDGMKRVPFRGSALHDDGAHDDGSVKNGHSHNHDYLEQPGQSMRKIDAHLWLDIDNAIAFARNLAKAVSKLDPDKADRAQKNVQNLIEELRALDQELREKLDPVKNKPFITYHDAYHYFEDRYGLNSRGVVTADAHALPGVRHLTELRKIFKAQKAVCLFTEPQFPPKLGASLTRGTSVRLATLDPLGADITPGPDQYFALMRALGKNLSTCLSK